MTGAVLGYLVSNFLIDARQYEAWRELGPEELKQQLQQAGIMGYDEFDEFSRQLAGEAMAPVE